MDAGQLDRRVRIKRPVTIDDGLTTGTQSLQFHCACWASFKPFNGREVYQNQGREGRPGGSFWVRSNTETREIDGTFILTFEDEDHEILSVTPMGRRDLIEIVAIRRA